MQRRNVVAAYSGDKCRFIETNTDKENLLTSGVRYSKLQDDQGFEDIQFQVPPPKVPWKAIGLATLLFVIGSILIIVGILLLTGVIDAKYRDRTWPVLILGSILFIPGFYHVRIAYYAFKSEPGYSFDDIPDFD